MICKIWPEVILAINYEKPSLGAVLEDYLPKELNNNTLEISADDKSDFNSKTAQKGKAFLKKRFQIKLNSPLK